MPVLSSFLLLACLSSLGLPLLNGFVGEFLILLGVFEANVVHAALATFGVVLAAVYLLWMYQRVAFGQVTKEVNKTLPDVSRRELAILIPLAVLVVWMGVFSPMFTRRMESTTKRILFQAQSPHYQLAESVDTLEAKE
jgi:NADH-quinone oxidoreductase subunit M